MKEVIMFMKMFLSKEAIQSMCIVIYETFSILLFIEKFFKARPKWGGRERLFFITTVVLITTFIVRIFSAVNIQKSIALVLFNTIILVFYYDISILQAFFAYLVPHGINLSIDISFLFLLKYFSNERYTAIMSGNISAFFFTLLCKTVFFLVIVCIIIFWKGEDNLKVLDRKEWMMFFYIPVFTFISCWIFIRNGEAVDKYAPEFYGIAFGMIFLNIIAFCLIKYIVRKESNIRNIELMAQYKEAQIMSYHNLNKEYDKQRKYIHDYKNQLNCIQGMLQKENVKEAVSYISSLTGSMEKDINLIHTGNPVVDAVLNQKYSISKNKNIPVIFSINDLSNLIMREEDIVSLLANLFDNAIEACEKLEEGKKIFCKLMMNDIQFIISIQNPIKKEIIIKDGIISTEKSDKRKHGIGLLNIESVIKKYGGSYSVAGEHGEFCFSAVIPINNEK